MSVSVMVRWGIYYNSNVHDYAYKNKDILLNFYSLTFSKKVHKKKRAVKLSIIIYHITHMHVSFLHHP